MISDCVKSYLRHAAEAGQAEPQALLDLLERVEALEQRPIPGINDLDAPAPEAAPVATDAELKELCWGIAGESYGFSHTAIRAVYDLGRQHGAAQPPAAQPTPPVAPAVGLVERVAKVIADPPAAAGLWFDDARAAIREVAAWLDAKGQHGCSLWLREEADR